MRKPSHPIRKRKRITRFVEARACVPCPRWVQKRTIANLQKAASCRVDPGRSKRARQLLQETESEPTAPAGRGTESSSMSEHRISRLVEQPAPVTTKVNRRRSIWSGIRQCFDTGAKWVRRTRQHGHISG
jgi:hypothetical protein